MNKLILKKDKERLLALLAEEDEFVLAQAYIYAKNLHTFGINVSEKWETVTQQSEALNRAYLQGRYEEHEYLLQAESEDKEWYVVFYGKRNLFWE